MIPKLSKKEQIKVACLSDVARQVGCGMANCHSCRFLEPDIDDGDYCGDEESLSCGKLMYGDGTFYDLGVRLDMEKPCWEPDFWEVLLPEFRVNTCDTLKEQLAKERKFLDFVSDLMPTDAYCEYMALADELFDRIRDGTTESREKADEIQRHQAELWAKMTPDEQIQADDTVLRTVIYLEAIREKRDNNRIP